MNGEVLLVMLNFTPPQNCTVQRGWNIVYYSLHNRKKYFIINYKNWSIEGDNSGKNSHYFQSDILGWFKQNTSTLVIWIY